MGVFVIDKPLHLTSFDVVARVRKRLGTRRVGHTGTLDPLASGVLVVTSDESTKLVQFLEPDSKDYLAWVSFGVSTPTLDAEGPVLERVDLQAETLENWREAGQLEAALAGLRGPQAQLPPAFSAIHINGERAYDLARKGLEVKLAPRQVVVKRLELANFRSSMQAFANLEYGFDGTDWCALESGSTARQTLVGRRFDFPAPLAELPTVLLNLSVSSGTYVRSLARDLGAALGVPAHLAGLVRTRVGRFRLADAQPPEQLVAGDAWADLDALNLPSLELSAQQAKDVRDGKPVASTLAGLVVLTCQQRLVAVCEGDGARLRVRRAWV